MNQIICADVLEGMKQIADDSVHLIVTSPPFNVGIKYDKYNDDMPHIKYLKWLFLVWKECKRVLCTGGRICINIDATTNLEENGLPEKIHPLHVDFTNQLRELGFLYRAEVNWLKQNAASAGSQWGSYCLPSDPHIRRNIEYIVIASKDSHKLVGDSMMSDMTKDEFHKWTLSEWSIKPETNNKLHPAPFPYEIARRCIKLFSFVGNTVLDPFSGSGTTVVAAYEHGRNYIGIDNSALYCQIAQNHIKSARNRLYSESLFYQNDGIHHVHNGYVYIPSPIAMKMHKDNKHNCNFQDREIQF